MNTQIDSLTIKDFESRYGIARSNVNNRLSGLKQKGYFLEPEKQDGKNVYNAEQIAWMDQLDAHIKAGGTIATFPAADGEVELSYVSQDKPQVSYKTQDMKAEPPLMFGGMVMAIAEKVADILALRQPPQPSAPTDPLANLRALQEACDRGWELKTSQLAALLGLKSLHGTEIKRHGFTFTKVGKIGPEAAWKITKG